VPALYIWSPTVVDGATLELLITRGDVSGIADGTREFAQVLLATLGVNADVTAWTVEPFRSTYFSEYLDEEDWRDRWQPVWRIGIQTSAEIDSLPEPAENGVGTDAGDDSWTPERRLRDDAEIRCLVLADFAVDETAEVERAVSDLVVSARGEVPQFRHVTIPGAIHQLQIDLGTFPASFFSGRAELAAKTTEVCEALGGTVHFQQRPAG